LSEDTVELAPSASSTALRQSARAVAGWRRTKAVPAAAAPCAASARRRHARKTPSAAMLNRETHPVDEQRQHCKKEKKKQ
jgi:hypothetical protein